MKIIHLCVGKANPHRMNGVNKVVHYLSGEQKRQGLDVQVWGITRTPEDGTFERDYPLTLFKGHDRRFKMPQGMRAAIEGLSMDTIIHFHGVMVPVFYPIARLLKKKGIQWVLAPHAAYNPVSMKNNAWMKWPYVFLFDQFLIRHAKAIHAIAPNEMEAMQYWAKDVPLAVVTNAQNLDDLAFEYQDMSPNPKPVFGFVGRLKRDHKGLDILLDGFANYLKQGGQGQLWLVGDGPDREFLQNKAKEHNLGDRITFHGAHFGQDKFNLIANMDVFVHTSRWDVSPTAVMEAAGFSKPAFISEETNIGDLVREWDAGYVLSDNTPAVVAEMMLKVDQEQNLLPQKGANARKMIEEVFNWANVANTLMEKAYKG